MTARHLQIALGLIFLLLGSWVVLFAAQVERLVLTPDHFMGTTSSAVILGCFGAQAILCGTIILSARFTKQTFLIFGLVGSLPFFAFNYYFMFVVPVFSGWMILDFLGNLGILACGLGGWRMMSREGRIQSDA